jgi:hypothetical protein
MFVIPFDTARPHPPSRRKKRASVAHAFAVVHVCDPNDRSARNKNRAGATLALSGTGTKTHGGCLGGNAPCVGNRGCSALNHAAAADGQAGYDDQRDHAQTGVEWPGDTLGRVPLMSTAVGCVPQPSIAAGWRGVTTYSWL